MRKKEYEAKIDELMEQVVVLKGMVDTAEEVRKERAEEHRQELNDHMLAGMLLMREVIRANSTMQPGVHPTFITKVGIKALAPYVDPGMLKLNIDSMQMLAQSIALRLSPHYGLEKEVVEIIGKAVSKDMDQLIFGRMQNAALKPVEVRLKKRWLALATSNDTAKYKLVVDALRGLGLQAPNYMPWSADERAAYLAMKRVPCPTVRRRK